MARGFRLTIVPCLTQTSRKPAGALSPLLLASEAEHKRLFEDLGHALIVNETACFAWVLLPDRAELLLDSTSPQKVRGVMESLNRRWRSIHRGVCPSTCGSSAQVRAQPISGDHRMLEAMLDLHLRPIEVGAVVSLAQLESHPWTGHAVLMDRWSAEFQDTASVLSSLADQDTKARDALSRLMAAEALARFDGMRWIRDGWFDDLGLDRDDGEG